MPRSARLDAPGVLHHLMIRGIERRKIFWNDEDRVNFLDRPSRNPGVLDVALSDQPSADHLFFDIFYLPLTADR